MYYLKLLFFSFFIVFFANHILPGIDVANQTKLPHIGGDLIFSAALGFLNSLIFPFLRLVDQATPSKIALFALVVNCLAYALLKVVPIGVYITSFVGYAFSVILVTIGSFVINFIEMKHKKAPPLCQDPIPKQTENLANGRD